MFQPLSRRVQRYIRAVVRRPQAPRQVSQARTNLGSSNAHRGQSPAFSIVIDAFWSFFQQHLAVKGLGTSGPRLGSIAL